MNKNFKIIGIIILIVIAVLSLLNLNKSERTDWRKNFDINKHCCPIKQEANLMAS